MTSKESNENNDTSEELDVGQQRLDVSIGREISNFITQVNACSKSIPLVMLTLQSARQVASEKHHEFLEEHGELIEETEKGRKYRINATIFWQLVPLRKDYEDSIAAYRLVPRSFIVTLVSQFDFFLGRLIRAIYIKRPEFLHSAGGQISLEELIDFGSIETAKEFLLEKEIEGVLRKSHSDQFDWMEKKFNLPLRTSLDIWVQFIELTERRNLFVHTGGIVSSQYCSVCEKHGVNLDPKIKAGVELGVNREYFESSYACIFELGIKLGNVLWRKIYPDEIEDSDQSLMSCTYDLIVAEQYSLAENLLEFAINTLKKHSSENSRRINLLNLAQAYKWQGKVDECNDIIDKEDWSACSDKFNLGISVLRDDFVEASMIMRRIGNEGEVDEGSYLTWPIFKEFRLTEEFRDAFESIFGHPLEAIDQEIKEDAEDYLSA